MAAHKIRSTAAGRWAAGLSGSARLARLLPSGRPRRDLASHPQRSQGGESPETGPEQRPREHVERIVHAKVDARESDPRGDTKGVGTHTRTEDRDRGRGGEGSRRVAGGEGRAFGDRDQRSEPRIGLGRPRPPEQILQGSDDQRRGEGRSAGGEEGLRRAAAPEIAAEPETDQQRALDPPGRKQHEEGRQERLLERRRGPTQRLIDFNELREQGSSDASNRHPLLIAVNARASGVDDPDRTAEELLSIAGELHARADAVVTRSEADVFEALRGALATERRVVLGGGDGSLHGAANAPLGRLPELALVPAGRANNIARSLQIPSDRAGALAVATDAPARPLDALRVETPQRGLYALESVSAGFQAQARSRYEGENSADLRQGLRALADAVRDFAPFELRASIDGERLVSHSAAQLFLSNLPYFGFGFQIDPGADHADGRLEAILFEAGGRTALMRLLAASYRGHHLEHNGVRRIPAQRVELTDPLPLVADATPLGTTTATVSVISGRLGVAAPGPRSTP
jgi:diacylglycerol kinase (ATP)